MTRLFSLFFTLILALACSACDEEDFNFGGDCKNDGECGDDLFCCKTSKC